VSKRVRVVHLNDELDTKPETILPDKYEFYWLLFHNVSSGTLYLSFDGTNWKRVDAGGTLELTAPPDAKICLTEPLKGKASAEGLKYEMLMIVDY